VKNKYQQEGATLLVFCKQPRLNQGKQRIAATLGAETAFNLASALLDCALEDATKWRGSVVLSPAGPEEIEWAQGLLTDAEVLAQPQGSLGQRIMAVDQQLRDQGHKKIIIIGTDAPILNERVFTCALDALKTQDVTFSAAEDGGVTLMGSNSHWPEIADLPWSTDRLGEALYHACIDAERSVAYAPPSYDIDYEKDLHKLIVDLADDVRSSRQALLRLVQSITHNDTIKVTS